VITQKTPMVSVICCFHNEQRYLRTAVESILAQTFRDFELILVDDYSTDASLEVCESFADPRVRVFTKTAEPRYLAASRNYGVRMARAPFVTFQDADDVSDPTRLDKQLTVAMDSPGVRIVGCGIRRVKNGLERIVSFPEHHEQIIKGFHRSYKRTTIVGGTILAPRSVFEATPYHEQFKYMQDWDHLLRLHEAGVGEFCNVSEPLYTYFIRRKGVLNQPDWLDYNVYVRHCQSCRRNDRPECETLESFRSHLDRHPVEKARWMGLRQLLWAKQQLAATPLLGRLL
jgi:glycosyltransferase involved in cell wall biosynthesis